MQIIATYVYNLHTYVAFLPKVANLSVYDYLQLRIYVRSGFSGQSTS